MDIAVPGTGCANCKATIALIEQMAQAKGVPVTLSKVEELRDIMGDGALWHDELAIDFVCNRLTDFHLEHPASAALREAWLQQGVAHTEVLTAAAGDRRITTNGGDGAQGNDTAMKFDLRAYACAYAGEVQCVAARL